MLPKTRKSKKAVSVIIGYVLLVAFAIVLGGLTYTWVKTYVPSSQELECSDGVSIFVKESVFNDSTPEFPERLLKITLKNTGRFNIGGYFIHATNDSSQKLATIDLSPYLNETFGGTNLSNSILFSSGGGNFLKSGVEISHVFDIPFELETLQNVKITPIRFEEVGDRERFVSCQNSITEQVIGDDIGVSGGGGSGGLCDPECGNPTPYCLSGSCVECITNLNCDAGDFCNVNNMCETPAPPPITEGIIFVSSSQHSGNLGGIIGADTICKNLANGASPPLSGTFVAWLSDSTHNAKDRISIGASFKRTDDLPIADDLNDLLNSGTDLNNKINVDESGNDLGNGHAWTGTDLDGTAHANNCLDWTSSSSGDDGVKGETHKISGNLWTTHKLDEDCDKSDRRIYCFEVDNSATSCGDGTIQYPSNGEIYELCDDGNSDNSDSCPDGVGGICKIATCGDGFIWNTDGGTEQCDDENVLDNDGCSSTCQIGSNWICTGEPSSCVPSGNYGIEDYCPDLGLGYTDGACVLNNGGCNNQGGELVPGGDVWCTNLGCCIPALP